MMFIPGLRRELRVLALLLTAYFMSLTWTVSAVSTDTVLTPNATTTHATTTQATTTQTSPTSKTSASLPTSAPSSTVTKASIKASATPVPTAETGRKFDGASFVGGIILGVVLAIIFILAFKWWQSKNKSYHSL